MSPSVDPSSLDDFRKFWNFGALLALFVGAVGLAAYFAFTDRPETSPKFAYGCFESAESPSISIVPEGIELAVADGTIVVPFELKYTRGYRIGLTGSYELVPSTEGYLWEKTDRGWSYMLVFRGREAFANDYETDPNALNVFTATTSDRRFLNFSRTGPENCDGTRAP